MYHCIFNALHCTFSLFCIYICLIIQWGQVRWEMNCHTYTYYTNPFMTLGGEVKEVNVTMDAMIKMRCPMRCTGVGFTVLDTNYRV